MASILIIDDQPEILKVLRRILEMNGHEVSDAPDGKTALRHFAGKPTDAVITDIFMPEMDGIELIMRIRETFPEAKIIAMSGGGATSKDTVLSAASVLGAEATLDKPFTAGEVLSTIERVLGGSEEG